MRYRRHKDNLLDHTPSQERSSRGKQIEESLKGMYREGISQLGARWSSAAVGGGDYMEVEKGEMVNRNSGLMTDVVDIAGRKRMPEGRLSGRRSAETGWGW